MNKRVLSLITAIAVVLGMTGCTVLPKTAAKKDVKVIETAKDNTFNDDIRAGRRANGTEVKPVKPTAAPEPSAEPSAPTEATAESAPVSQPTQNNASGNAQSYTPASNSAESYSYASNDSGSNDYVEPAQDNSYSAPAQNEEPAPAPAEQPASTPEPTPQSTDSNFPYSGVFGSLTLDNGYSVALGYYGQSSVDAPYMAAYDSGSVFGCEYICDHARRKPDALAATENSNVMWIKDANGNVRTLYKKGSVYADNWSLQIIDSNGNTTGQGNCFDWDVLNSYGATLVFQTCALDAPWPLSSSANLITYWG